MVVAAGIRIDTRPDSAFAKVSHAHASVEMQDTFCTRVAFSKSTSAGFASTNDWTDHRSILHSHSLDVSKVSGRSFGHDGTAGREREGATCGVEVDKLGPAAQA